MKKIKKEEIKFILHKYFTNFNFKNSVQTQITIG